MTIDRDYRDLESVLAGIALARKRHAAYLAAGDTKSVAAQVAVLERLDRLRLAFLEAGATA